MKIEKSKISKFIRKRIAEELKHRNISNSDLADALSMDNKTVSAKLSPNGSRELTVSEFLMIGLIYSIDVESILMEALEKFSDLAVGNSGSAVGNSGSAVGNSGSAVGNSGSAVGNSGSAVGNSGSAVGNSGSAVGNSGSAVGNSGSAVGLHIPSDKLRLAIGDENVQFFMMGFLTLPDTCTPERREAASKALLLAIEESGKKND